MEKSQYKQQLRKDCLFSWILRPYYSLCSKEAFGGERQRILDYSREQNRERCKAALVMVVTAYFQCCCIEDSPTIGLIVKENRNLI